LSCPFRLFPTLILDSLDQFKIILIAGVPSSQALPGFLITVPPSVCVPDAIGALAVWIQNPKKKNPVPVPVPVLQPEKYSRSRQGAPLKKFTDIHGGLVGWELAKGNTFPYKKFFVPHTYFLLQILVNFVKNFFRGN